MKMGKRESKINSHARSLLRRMVVGAQLLFWLSLAPPILAQTAQQPEVWEPLKYFVGSWEGSGDSKVEREYQFVLKGKYLQAKNESTYLPQEKNPKGEVHED